MSPNAVLAGCNEFGFNESKLFLLHKNFGFNEYPGLTNNGLFSPSDLLNPAPTVVVLNLVVGVTKFKKRSV